MWSFSGQATYFCHALRVSFSIKINFVFVEARKIVEAHDGIIELLIQTEEIWLHASKVSNGWGSVKTEQALLWWTDVLPIIEVFNVTKARNRAETPLMQLFGSNVSVISEEL